MKKYLFTLILFSISFTSFSQYRVSSGGSFGSEINMITLGFEREFNVVSKEIHVNPGLRVNAFNGSSLDFITAPAEYTVNDSEVDTLFMPSVQSNFANLYVRLGYDITEKLSVSFDIDLVGVSFGSEQNDNVFKPGEDLQSTNIGSSSSVVANPTQINALLVGDNDLGSLNSTFMITYNLTKRLGIDAGLTYVFTEYTTDLSIGYDGNDRFRNKSAMGYFGVSYLLGNK